VMPEREIVLAREVTKKFEEFLRGTASELLALLATRSIRGEFVVLVGTERREKECFVSTAGSS